MTKRLLSVILALTLVLSFAAFPITAASIDMDGQPLSAAGSEPSADIEINIGALTVTSGGITSDLTVYSEEDYSTFYSAYQAGTLDNVYVTEFLFDGAGIVKKYSIDTSTSPFTTSSSDIDITVINVNCTGNIEFTGTATGTMIAVNTNNKIGSINLLLNAIDLTSVKYAPAIMAYNTDVTYDACTVTVVPMAGTVSNITGGTLKKVSTMASDSLSGTYASYPAYYGIYTSSQLGKILFASETADAEKISEGAPTTYYKSSGAISCDIDMTFNGAGTLNITSLSDEGVETKGDLIFTGGVGNYIITSQDDGINASTDGTDIYIDVESIQVIVADDADEGDGIDSNGTIHIEGGFVLAKAAASSSDAGIDSDDGTYINGGVVVGTGNMADEIQDSSSQPFIFLSFASQQSAGTTVTLTDTSGSPVIAYTSDRTFTQISFSSPDMVNTTYYVYKNGTIVGTAFEGIYYDNLSYTAGTQQCYTSVGIQGGPGGEGGTPPDGEGGTPPDGEGGTPPDGEGGTPPGGEGGTPPDGEGGTPPDGEGGTPPGGEGGQGGPGGPGQNSSNSDFASPGADEAGETGNIEFVITSSQHSFSGVTDYTGSAEVPTEIPTETPSESAIDLNLNNTIAAWEFDSTNKTSGDKLKEYGNGDDGYAATTGNGTLILSVDGESGRALEWSDAEYGESGTEVVPIMAAGKKNLWGTPYIQVQLEAAGYEDLTFTAYIAGSNKAPATWQLSYSTDGENFTDIDDAAFTISTDNRKLLTAYLDGFALPDDAADVESLYLRLTPTSTVTVSGGDTTDDPTGGEIALNYIVVTGTQKNDNENYLLGDADGDGKISILDATYIQRYLAGLSVPDSFNYKAACVDGEKINILDATYIQRYLASISVPYAINEWVE